MNAPTPLRARNGEAAVARWFEAQGWRPLAFQERVWAQMEAGRSGLLHAATGSGKTLAVGLGAWLALQEQGADAKDEAPPLMLLWITPMRALAADTARGLSAALAGVHALHADQARPWSLGLRTGDTGSKERAAQARRQPTLLVTTPESLSLMLSRLDAREQFAALRCVVVDEWHELLGNKRGVQTQLALARLKLWRPDLLVWGMSATLGNLEEALRILLGPSDASSGVLIEGRRDKKIVIDTLLPSSPERFPWAGYLGLKMLPQVVAEIERSANTLVFTNTRSQAEIWYKELLQARPEWAGVIAVHHASIDRVSREWVEQGLKTGALKAVVCTSSLDLGVDFLPVERVLQIGSPKGVARLLQRAGRSGHAPGRASRITIVPSHSLELVESAAVQAAAAKGRIESQTSPSAPLDVLAQHLVTIALGGGFRPDALLAEVSTTVAYENLDDENWRWCLDFVRRGGPTLRAYPDYRRCEPGADGVWRVPSQQLAVRHRFNIGTIASDAGLQVQYGPTPPGKKLGVVEEIFIARMTPGDRFWFAGRLLELAKVRDSTAYVRKASGGKATIPRWGGGRMPLSTTLADAMVEQMALAAQGRFDSPELQAASPMLKLQNRWSALPTPDTLLAETVKTRDGWHLFLYPFAGRNVHLGLASLLAWRAGQASAGTFSMAVNDYGFELLSGIACDWARDLPKLLDASSTMDQLRAQVFGSLNAGELTRRRFREIARIAGLVPSAHPGVRKSARQLQASSSLFYDVFRKYDPDNALLQQAEREVLEKELDIGLLRDNLARMNGRRLVHKALARCSPLAFPLMVEGFREKLSNEALTARIERMAAELERAADR
jgi:ATP-dependent helicase Lhr and Lhr-like helicase